MTCIIHIYTGHPGWQGPFAYLVAAVDSDVRREDAVGAENLRHLGVLFLQVALKLFVPHWQCGEQVLNADRGTALKQRTIFGVCTRYSVQDCCVNKPTHVFSSSCIKYNYNVQRFMLYKISCTSKSMS